MVPDKNGKLANVVKGHYSIYNVINSHEPFLSTLIGRYGNRIAKGSFLMNGQEHNLTIKMVLTPCMEVRLVSMPVYGMPKQEDEHSVTLHYLSKDGEEGFPGNLDVTVTYTLTGQNELVITYVANCDKKTIINLTNHAFFSL